MDIINIIKLKHGVVSGISSYGVWEEQESGDVMEITERDFRKLIVEDDPYVSDDDLEFFIEHGYDNLKGYELQIVRSQIT